MVERCCCGFILPSPYRSLALLSSLFTGGMDCNQHFLAAVKDISSTQQHGLSVGKIVDFGVSLFGVPDFPSKLYIRPSFVTLAECVLKEWKALMLRQHSSNEKDVIDKVEKALLLIGSTTTREQVVAYLSNRSTITVTGNPGIGKTSFIAYLAVVCHSAGIAFQYFGATSHGPRVRGSAAIDEHGIVYPHFPRNKKCISAFDHDPPGDPPRAETGYVVFLTSPNYDRTKHFIREAGFPVYLPIWNLEHLEACRQACYPSVPEDVVKTLFAVFGGIPRYLIYLPSMFLGPASSTTKVVADIVEESLETKIKKIKNVEALVALIRNIEGWTADDASHALFHYVLREPENEERHFSRSEREVKIASNHVYQLLVDHLGAQLHNQRLIFDTMLKGAAKFAVAVGWMYESNVHNRFSSEDVTTEMRVFRRNGKEYVLGGEEQITLPTRRKRYFHSLDEIVCNFEAGNRVLLHIPTFPNQGGFDSFSVSLVDDFHIDVYQITVARSHRVKTKYIKELCEKLFACFGLTCPSDVRIRFIFVVPARNFGEFNRMQRFQKPQGQETYTVIPYTVCVLRVSDEQVEARMTDNQFCEEDLHEERDGV
eukprot:gb/GECG01006054.1/.p1 GENE.gb/GECG01006054.1/~~gb/GECG01006054.1/.p1  ORF type:complete len:596 (+),score=49.64 gb/GECG01006054.1/:1-1788(+)